MQVVCENWILSSIRHLARSLKAKGKTKPWLPAVNPLNILFSNSQHYTQLVWVKTAANWHDINKLIICC